MAPFISGANYTFFVPTDEAFERIGLDKLSDEDMASETGVKFLLHHFVKGRLYDKDLKHDEVFETIGGDAVKIQRLLPGRTSDTIATCLANKLLYIFITVCCSFSLWRSRLVRMLVERARDGKGHTDDLYQQWKKRLLLL